MNSKSPQPGLSSGRRPVTAIAMLAVIVLAAGGIFYWQWSRPAEPTQQAAPAVAAAPDNRIRRFSDGMLIEPEAQAHRWYAVMVENSSEAWPLSGISEARLVFEAPVEGSIPRFMVLFDDTQSTDKIGPVRSARPYYIDWAIGLRAMYAHVGGSPDALGKINALSVQDLNQFYWDDYFWRSTDRYAPHNVYTSVEKLGAGYAKRGYKDTGELPKLGWEYDDAVLATGDPAQRLRISFSPISDDYDAVWDYDANLHAYTRSQNSEAQADQNGARVFAANVVVLKMDIAVVDDVGRRSVETIGKGKGELFRDGQRFTVSWKKTSRESPLMLLNEAGEPVKLRAGTTWIEVVPLSTDVMVQASQS